jgi:magnesium transporter
MLTSYPRAAELGAGSAQPLWVDLLDPTAEEKARIAAAFDLQVPTREHLEEIESSSRVRADGPVLYLSMPLLRPETQAEPRPVPLGFVLSPDVLITVRFSDVRAFEELRARLERGERLESSAAGFATLIEAMVDYGADVLESISTQLAELSQRVFVDHLERPKHARRVNRALRHRLVTVGLAGERLSQIRETLLGMQRIATFTSEAGCEWLNARIRERLRTVRHDLSSLTDFEGHLSGKAQFLLDAILGFINTQQNETFKVLTIVSVVGIPPTLIASMYGMNFRHMPELEWSWGYPYGLVLIAVSIIVPIVWFRWRGWW